MPGKSIAVYLKSGNKKTTVSKKGILNIFSQGVYWTGAGQIRRMGNLQSLSIFVSLCKPFFFGTYIE